MEVKKLFDFTNAKTFLTKYLKLHGIKDTKKFLNPDDSCYEDFHNYNRIEEAIDFIKEHSKDYNNYYVVVDSDCDGIFSATLITLALQQIGINLTPVFHSGKQHGIYESILENFADNSLIFVPDASVKNKAVADWMADKNCFIIETDHHITTLEANNIITINNQRSEKINNKSLSGTGVTYKFCEALGLNVKQYKDLVAVSIISDVCDVSTMENRVFLQEGINNICNPMLQYMMEKCGRNDYSPHGFGWNIVPLINAICRIGTTEEMQTFFDAMIGKVDITEGLKIARRVKRRQDEKTKEITAKLEANLDNSHKGIICFTENDNADFSGLCANKMLSKYHKPCFILRPLTTEIYTGSLRSPVPLLTKINNSGIANIQGHENAAGIFIEKEKLDDLIKFVDNLDLSENGEVEEAIFINPEDISFDICKVLEDNKILFGHGLEEIKWYIKSNINLSAIQVFRKNTNTVKFNIYGIDFLKFQASEEEIEQFHNGGIIEMIVTLSINEWEGVRTVQGIVSKYEIHNPITNTNNWLEDF